MKIFFTHSVVFILMFMVGLMPFNRIVFAEESVETLPSLPASGDDETLPESVTDGVEESEATQSELTEENGEEEEGQTVLNDEETITEIENSEALGTEEVEILSSEYEEREDADNAPLSLAESEDNGVASTSGHEEGSNQSSTTPTGLSFTQHTGTSSLPTELVVEGSAATSSETPVAGTGTPTIVSGEAIALANILNMVNSNFVNSEGVVLFSNFFETVFGAIDFREYFGNLFGCSLISCEGEHVQVNVADNAAIDNEVSLLATSGNNHIDGAGQATILTGDAYAGLNLINVANTNLVDSNYLLVTLNAFQNVNGDIVFPSLSQFFSTLSGGATTPATINIDSTAGVTNTVHVDASSGDNSVSTTNGGRIETGSAVSSGNVFNQLNSSLIGGQSVSIVFRVHGNWAGEVFGAPDNLAWTVGDDGSVYLFDVGTSGSNGTVNMTGANTVLINNNVSVVALTGENAVTNAETAVISTGNAYAGANIINVANANVIGRNWILAVINIFGDFNGNIAFGRPDLWVGGQIDVPTSIKNGSELAYTFTVINNGDSPATNVVFENTLKGDRLKIIEASHPYTQNEDAGVLWQLGTIPPGGAVEISYSARVQNAGYGTELTTVASARERETDNNMRDNTETLSVTTDKKLGNGVKLELQKSSVKKVVEEEIETSVELKLSRLTLDSIMSPHDNKITEKLILRNTTDQVVKNVVLHDVLRDPEGVVVQDEVWELGDVLPGEEIELGYVMSFNQNAVPGIYVFDTLLKGDNNDQEFLKNGSITFNAPILPLTQDPLAADPVFKTVKQEVVKVMDSQSEKETEEDSKSVSAFISPLLPPIASAAENDLAAAAIDSGYSFPFGVNLPFLILTAALLTLFLMRLLSSWMRKLE